MAVLPLQIKTDFAGKKILFLIKDELSTNNGYTTIFIDQSDNLWYQNKGEFQSFEKSPMSIVVELYIYFVYEDDVLCILKELDMRTAVETYIKIVYGGFLKESQVN